MYFKYTRKINTVSVFDASVYILLKAERNNLAVKMIKNSRAVASQLSEGGNQLFRNPRAN